MKKSLLFAAFAAVALSASAQEQWAVVGAYTDPGWNFEASSILTGSGDELSVKIDKFKGDFKIVEISNNNWDVQYGTATPVEIGVPVTLQGKNGGADPANIKFAGLIQEVNNATVTFNTKTFSLTVDAQPSDIIYGYPELWMTGSFCEWPSPGEGNSVKCEFDQATTTYTCKVNLGDSGNVTFKLAGTGWANEVAGPEDGVVIGNEEATPVTMGGKDLTTTLTGEQTLTFNISTMLMTFGDPSLVNITGGESAVGSVEAADDSTVEYFNLQGIKVVNPEKGIYIVKQGNKATKMVF